MTATNNLHVAKELRQRIAAIPGIADAHLQQEVDAPAFYADDRPHARGRLGLTANAIATNINVSLSSSEQVSPNFWTDPTSGIPYYIAVQTPEPQVSSLDDLGNTPVSTGLSPQGESGAWAAQQRGDAQRGSVPTNTNQANIQPVYEVYASIQGRDLGGVSGEINKIVAELQKKLSPGNTIQIVGQIQSMNDAFRDLGIGLLFAAVFVFLLMVVNYQNFGDPFVVILALPATLCGILDDAVHHRHDAERSLADGRDHGGRCRIGELNPARDVCARAAACRQDRLRGRDRCRPHPDPAGADDGRRDDRRHDPDGDRRRRRGAERGPGARRDRRPVVCNADHPARRALSLRHAAKGQRRQDRAWRIRGGHR